MEKYLYMLLYQNTNTGEEGNSEVQFFSGMHKSLMGEFEAEISALSKTQNDVVQKTISSLRGGLSTYLSTPLMSDKGEIERTLRDNIENAVKQLGVEKTVSASRLFSYRILDYPQIPLNRQLVGVMRRLIKNGKTMLVDGGVNPGKNSTAAYLTIFSVDEFATLPLLKSKIDEFNLKGVSPQYVIVNDCISNIIVMLLSDSSSVGHTILINFDGQDYLSDKLNDKLPKLLDQFGAKNVRLSKRTFHAGFGTKFQLQFVVDLNKQALGSIIMALVGDDAELEDALTTQGSLIVLEKIV